MHKENQRNVAIVVPPHFDRAFDAGCHRCLTDSQLLINAHVLQSWISTATKAHIHGL